MRKVIFPVQVILTLTLVLTLTQSAQAQQHSLHGHVLDEKTSLVPYATVALLNPDDSTLSYYSVTNLDGAFEMRNIVEGKYILQAALLGYKTFYLEVAVPSEKTSKELNILLEPRPVNLPEAEINAERIPLLIRGDTIEYDAAAFKTKPDAVVEDLLKKLPGVAVDRNGNVKAQGEDVRKVTVDGKEFFGNDPKVATKNLPADAIDKVQVFDTKSDEAELTGINDGQRDKTINLQLKDDKKNAWFGEAEAGAGTKEHYQSVAKAYRFTPERQIALMGMLNNINRFGFSFTDYMNFNGGFGGGGEFRLSSDDNFPINFGEVEKGKITSGGLGANYTVEKRKDNRYNFSYLGNGINKSLNEDVATTNFTDASPFYTQQNSTEKYENRAHRFNAGWKNKIDSSHTLNISAQSMLNQNDQPSSVFLSNTTGSYTISDQQSSNSVSGKYLNTTAHASYLTKMYSDWKLLSLEADGLWRQSTNRNDINTLTNLYSTQETIDLNQFQEKENDLVNYSAEAAITRKIGKETYIESRLSAGGERESYNREQGLKPESDGIIDSLSGRLDRNNQWVEPRIKFRSVGEKNQLSVSLGLRLSELSNEMNNHSDEKRNLSFLLPAARWEKEFSNSNRLMMFYESSIVTPTASELYPITNYFDPLNQVSGNRDLRPEIHHDFRTHWSKFDQFSFTSFFAGLQFSYVKNKINWKKSIDENLVQSNTLVNVPDNYGARLNAEYSMPIRKLGVNMSLSYDESWDMTYIYINDLLNRNSGLTHELGITFDNRKKTKWEVSAGCALKYYTALITLPEVPRQNFLRGNVFADINYNPFESWQFSAKADLSHYYGPAFVDNVYVPLLQAEASFLFMKNKRGMLTLSGFDLLNKNTGVERTSEYNYVREVRSDIIQRYVMLSFKYKLNKFTSKDNVDIKVR